MKILRLGLRDDDLVERWQYFLRGQSSANRLIVDGDFGPVTEAETKLYQSSRGLLADGIVASKTFAAAARDGFRLVDDDEFGMPAKPAFGPMNDAARVLAFGSFSYTPDPTSQNPEHVKIDPLWVQRNLVSIEVPLLKRQLQCHRLAAPVFTKFLQRVEQAGLGDRILSFNGGFAPRFKRGSRTRLSAHSWGCAIDLNEAQNRRGTIPATLSHKGTLVEIVPIGIECGLYWGGHFRTQDGMHFEVAQLQVL